jgi:DNA repair and recombination protein RAD52
MEEDRESGRVNLGLSVIVRVTLKDGVYHEVTQSSGSAHK